MAEPSAAVIEKLNRATARRAADATSEAVPAPPEPAAPKQPTVADAAAPDGEPAAGNATAKYVLLDHFFGGATGTFWTYDGTTWRAANTGEPADEQGMAQVAFAANRVDIWWDNNNAVTVVRSWKFL
jgi:hypothetical protein